MSSTPHYLRFARALALASGITGAALGCGRSHRSDDAGAPATAPPLADGGAPSTAPGTDAGPEAIADAGPEVDGCDHCTCGYSPGVPSCDPGYDFECCAWRGGGPLFPPSVSA